MKSVLILLSFFLNIYFGAYVARRGWRNITHRYFFYFAFFVSIWSLAQFLVIFISNLQNLALANWVGRLLFVFASLIPSSFLSFTFVFPSVNKIHFSKRLVFGSFVIGLIFGIFFLFTDFLMKGGYKSEWGLRPIYGPGFKYFTLYFMAFMFTGLFILLKKYFTTNDKYEKEQLKLVFYGVSISALIGISSSLILPLFGFRRYSDISSSFSIVMIGSIAYAILRYRFIDLKIAIRKGFANASIAGILIAILLITFTLMQGVPHFKDLFPPIPTIALIAFLIAFGFNKLSKSISYFVEYLIFKGKYDYPRIAGSFSKSIANILELEELKDSVTERFTNIFETRKCEILIIPFGRHPDFPLVSERSYDDSKTIEMQKIVDTLREKEETNNVLMKSELHIILPEQEAEELKAILELLECEVISVLQSENTIVGIIALGAKTNGSAYSLDEISLLGTLSTQAGIAFTRAIHYQENIDLKVQYENMLEHMSNGVILTDTSNNLVYLNVKAIEMFGMKSAERGKIRFDNLPDQVKLLVGDKNSNGAEQSSYELKIKLEDRKIIPLNLSFASLYAQGGEPIGTIAVLTDLTEVKKWEERVRQTDKLASLGTMAAGMAHEIKNPLSFIKSFMQMLPENLHDAQFLLSNVSIADKQVNSINFIVEQLLNYAQPSTPCLQELIVQEVIEESLVFLKKELQNKNIDIQRELPVKLVKLNADGKQMKQVFLNLFLNAIQSMEESEKRELIISVMEAGIPALSNNFNYLEDAEGEVIIKIGDSGEGILPQSVPHIFDPFFTTKDKGTGLGLSVVYSIVKEHGGTIDVETAPSRGTTFILAFPKNNNPLPQPFESVNTMGATQLKGGLR